MKKLKKEINELGLLMATIKDKYFGIPDDEEYRKDINKIIDNVTRIEFELYREEKNNDKL